MKVLISGCTATVAKWYAKRPDRVGGLRTPSDGNAIPELMVWAGDNDCFNGLNESKFLRFLDKCADGPTRPLWITCPDKVADAAETDRMFERWQPRIAEYGLPVAYVLQDGVRSVPWGMIAAIFVGGSTEFKVSDTVLSLIDQAKERGKLVHIGRVNSMRRIEFFARTGADTIDGSGFSKWGEARIPLAVKWIDRALIRKQTVMFGGNA